MIVITGSGRAGTSITAKLFDTLGFDLGDGCRWFEKYRAGYEPLSIVRLNEAIIASGVWGRSYTPLAKRAALVEQFRARMHEIAPRQQVVKDPRFAITLDYWHEAAVPIDYVVVCIRRPEECIESAIETGAGFALEGPESMLRGYHELIARIGRLFETLALRGIPFGILRYDHYIEDFLRLDLPLPANAEAVLRETFVPSPRTTTETSWTADDDTLERLGQLYPSSFPSKPEPPDGIQHDFERVVNWIHPHPPRLPVYELTLPDEPLAAITVTLNSPLSAEAIVRVEHPDSREAAFALAADQRIRDMPGGALLRWDAAEVGIRFARIPGAAQPGTGLRFGLLASAGKPVTAEAVTQTGGTIAVHVTQVAE